jgi:hypothetical protein
MILVVALIPAALLAGVLWGVAIEKHRAARRRGRIVLHPVQPDEPKRRAF